MKVKDRVRKKMENQNRPMKKSQIEVITLDDDEHESPVSIAPLIPATAESTSSIMTRSARKRQKAKASKAAKARSNPLNNIVNTISSLVNLNNQKATSTAATNPPKKTVCSKSGSISSGCSSMDSELIQLESDDDQSGNAMEDISILEVVEKDCHTVSFMNESKCREDVAVVEHIQHDLKSRERDLTTKVGHAVVYTDGSCREFYRTGELIAGIGVFWGPDDKRNVSELITGLASANRAEIQAAIRAIKTAIDYKYEHVTVYTDR